VLGHEQTGCAGKERAMGNALPKADRIYIPPRDKSKVARARQVEGFYDVQVNKAFSLAFDRYEQTLEKLSKV